MKFARQLAAVLLVVGIVVVLGVAWEHSSEADWVASPRPGGAFIIRGDLAKLQRGEAVRVADGRVLRLHPGPGAQLNFSNLQNLGTTAEIEAAVVAGVVVLSILARRRRRARRALLRSRSSRSSAG